MGRLHVRVQPGARRSAFVGWFGDLPKFAVAAPPVDGAANDATLRLIASTLGVPNRTVRLVGGAGSRTKRFEVDGVDHDDMIERLTTLVPPAGGAAPNSPGSR